MAIEIKRIDTDNPLYLQELELRHQVLRVPLGMSIYDDDPTDEPNQIHFVAVSDLQVVGVVVLKVEHQTGKLRQMAVSPEVQGQNLGTLLVNELENYARETSLKEIKLHARHYAVGFYEKLGYTQTEMPAFEEVGMEHFEMRKVL